MAFITQISIFQKDSADRVVSIEEAKDYLVIEDDDRDDEIDGFIQSATQALQNLTNYAFLPSDIQVTGWQRQRGEIVLPFTNDADLADLKGNRYSADKEFSLTYSAGSAPREWMKTAVLKYVADLVDNKGDNRSTKVGTEAKQFCKQFINHGGFF